MSSESAKLTAEVTAEVAARKSWAKNRVYAHLESGGVGGGYNLETIKEIAAEDRDAFPRDFIQLFMIASYYAPFLGRLILNEGDVDTYDYAADMDCFIEVFSWFVGEFGGTPTAPGYIGSGNTKEDFWMNSERASANHKWTEAYYASQGKSPNICLARLDLANINVLIDSFGDVFQIQRGMEEYIFEAGFENDNHAESCRWEKLKVMLARCRGDHPSGIVGEYDFRISKQRFDATGEAQSTSTLDEDLMGHSLLWLLQNPAHFSIPYSSDNTRRCLLWIRKHQHSVFEDRNNDGRTMLHIAVQESVRHTSLVEQKNWKNLALFILQKNPEACLIRDTKGKLPLDVCFQAGSPDLFHAIAAASAPAMALSSPSSLQCCRGTGLYPFQIAAARTSSLDSALDPADSLSRIYQLLQQTPSLVKDGICTGNSKRIKNGQQDRSADTAVDLGNKKRKSSATFEC